MNLIAGPLAESAITGGNRVWLFTGAQMFPINSQDEASHPGLDGVVGGGDAQFRFTFQAVAPGSAQILIGTGYQGDGVVLAGGQITQATSAVIDIVVLDVPAVPSFQAIALYTLLPILLIGTGLASLRRLKRIPQG